MLLNTVTLPFHDLKPELDHWKRSLGMEESFWFGRAATGLIAALKAIFAISPERKKVLIPALGCTTVANTVLLAGGEPVFVDVNPASGVMDVDDLQARIDRDCSAVVFVALYGNLTDPEPLLAACRRHNLLLIEDGAQALGSHWPDGTPLGGHGDFAVFSFNATKILENGGGVLFCRSSKAADILCSVLETWQIRESEPDDSSGVMMRDLQMGMAEAMKNRIKADFSSVYVKTVFQSAHLYAVPWKTADCNKWLKEWNSLDANLSHRVSMTNLYLDGLRPDRFTPLTGKTKGATVWRHSVLTPDRRFQRRAVAALRRNGLLASAHYWALPGYYTNQPEMCPNAVSVADKVLNLWVDSKVQEADVSKTIEILNRLPVPPPINIHKLIDSHVHLNMKEINPLLALTRNLASCNIEEAVLILNTPKEKEYFLVHFQEIVDSGFHWHIGVLVDLNSGSLETDLMNKLSACSIPFSIKIHSRISGLCLSDIPSLIKKIGEMPRLWENIIVDGFYYGSRLEHQIAMELAIALSRHYENKRIVYAHSGGIHILETLVHLRDRKNIYYDYSLSCNYLLHSSLMSDFVLFLKFNKQRIMFGSDYPDFSSKDAILATQTLCETASLSPEEQSAVFYGNAKNIYSFS